MFKSVWEREKKATSVPEISAEAISKKISTIALITISILKLVNKINKGSGSGSKGCGFR